MVTVMVDSYYTLCNANTNLSAFCDGTRRYVTVQKEVCEISAIENLCSRKLDQSSLMSLKICYTTMPLIVPNFVALGQTIYEKSVTNFFTPFSILASQRRTLGQSSLISALMYREAASINLPNFAPLWQPVYEISAAELC